MTANGLLLDVLARVTKYLIGQPIGWRRPVQALVSVYPTSDRCDEQDGRIIVIRVICTVAGVPRSGG
jgi:hypothetical protein